MNSLKFSVYAAHSEASGRSATARRTHATRLRSISSRATWLKLTLPSDFNGSASTSGRGALVGAAGEAAGGPQSAAMAFARFVPWNVDVVTVPNSHACFSE